MRFFKGYINSYSTESDIMYVYVSDVLPTQYNIEESGVNLAYALNKYSDVFSRELTLVTTTNDNKKVLEELGFTRSISVEGYTRSNPFRLYSNETNYVDYWVDDNRLRYDVWYFNEDTKEMGRTESLIPQGYNTTTFIPSYADTIVNNSLVDVRLAINRNTISTGIMSILVSVFTSGTPFNLRNYYFYRHVNFNDNPLEPGGISGTGGGTGNFDNNSDPVEIPNLPTLSATDTGLVKLYVPNLDELRLLSNFLWSDAWDISAQWKKLWGDPMQAILGLAIVPCIPEMSATPVPCVVGNINTGVGMKYATSQYKEVDCGSLNINEYWGSALDYSPYTQMQIYLPYIGYKTLNVDEVMNKTLRVVYHIDVMSGSCVALIQSGGSVLYQFNGVCSTMIPVSGSDWTNLYRSVLSIVATGVNAMAGVGIATGALEAAGSASQIFSAEAQMRSAIISGGAQGVGTGTKALTHSKMTVEHGSSMSGSCGMLGTQTPYIIAIRPRQSMPQGYNQFVGFPCNMSLKLSDCRGYTTVETVHLEGIKATQSEIDEIESLLMGGVIL